MKREVERYLELLERRLATLRLLALDLDESRSVIADLDLKAIHQHVVHQEDLCSEICLLDGELKTLAEGLAGGSPGDVCAGALATLASELDPASARQLQLLLGGLAAIQADVQRLSRVHRELLRRSRRSVNVLLNFLAQYSGTYQAPGNRSFLTSSLQLSK